MRRAPGLLLTVVVVATTAGCGSGVMGADSVPPTTDSKAIVATPEHAVIVHLRSANVDGVFALEDSLETAIAKAGVGEYDGNEIAVDGSEAILYAYGPDADALWNVIRPIVESTDPPVGSYVIKRYGEASDPAAREVRVELHGR